MDLRPPPDRDPNPYAPPEASLTEAPLGAAAPADLARAEAVREAHISHESSVKALGALNLLGGVLFLIGGLAFAVVTLTGQAGGAGLGTTGTVGVALLVVALGGLYLAVGIGLRRLQPWARWLTAVLMGLSLLSNVVSILLAVAGGGQEASAGVAGGLGGMLIPGYIFSLVVSKKGAMVFSPEYKEVIALTPHVKMKTSWIVKGCLIVLLVVLGLVIGAAVFRAVALPR